MRLAKCYFFLLFLFPIFGFSQITDSLLTIKNIDLILKENKEGKYDKAYERITQLHDALENHTQNNILLALTDLNKGKIEINLGK